MNWSLLTGDDCADLAGTCGLAACCTPCSAQALSFGDCVFAAQCGNTDCSNVVPVAPTPLVPTPSFPSLQPPTDDDTSPECIDESMSVQGCFLQNLIECGMSCAGEEDEDDDLISGFVCEEITSICEQISCCAPCISDMKAFVACEATARDCSENCDAVQPAAPSPVAPFNFFPPTAPFALFPPTAPSPIAPIAPFEPGPCDELQTAHFNCVVQNAFTCGSIPACSETTDETVVGETCDEYLDALCKPYTCCPQCAPVGAKVAECIFSLSGITGCTESTCGEFAPAAPSPIAPFNFGPTAPVVSPVGLEVCTAEGIAIEECAETNGCNDTCENPPFPTSCADFPAICGSVNACCAACESEAFALFNCLAAQDLGCSEDCSGAIAPVTATPVSVGTFAPATVAPVISVTGSPVTTAPMDAVSEAPVTAAPVDPVTAAPVTGAPVTAAPITKAPVTAVPVTAVPGTIAPATEKPVTAAPQATPTTTSAPIPDATTSPVTESPVSSGFSNKMGVGAIAGVIVAILSVL